MRHSSYKYLYKDKDGVQKMEEEKQKEPYFRDPLISIASRGDKFGEVDTKVVDYNLI